MLIINPFKSLSFYFFLLNFLNFCSQTNKLKNALTLILEHEIMYLRGHAAAAAVIKRVQQPIKLLFFS